MCLPEDTSSQSEVWTPRCRCDVSVPNGCRLHALSVSPGIAECAKLSCDLHPLPITAYMPDRRD